MDFIIELPLSKGCFQIWVIVNYFTKIDDFIPLKNDAKKALNLTRIFGREI
jgi:hypothetical protein